MIDQLYNLLKMIKAGKIINDKMVKDLDVENALNLRENPEFESQWLRVADSIKQIERAIPDDVVALIDEISKEAFLLIDILIGENSELADYVCDDFELIAKGIILDYKDGWLNALWLSYKRNHFPCQPLSPIKGDLAKLID